MHLETFSASAVSAIGTAEYSATKAAANRSPTRATTGGGATVVSGLEPSMPKSPPPSVWSPSKTRRVTPILKQPTRDTKRPVFDLMAKLCEPEQAKEHARDPALAAAEQDPTEQKEARVSIMELLFPPAWKEPSDGLGAQGTFSNLEESLLEAVDRKSGLDMEQMLTSCIAEVIRERITTSEAAHSEESSIVSKFSMRSNVTLLINNVEDVAANITKVVLNLIAIKPRKRSSPKEEAGRGRRC